MSTTNMGTATASARTPYGGTEAIEFTGPTGPTGRAVFAAAAEWCGPRERTMIIRAVTYDVYAPADENDCALTIVFEPM